MISVCIPTYDQKGYGPAMLNVLLHSIKKQRVSYPYEVIISDNATNDKIKQVCDKYPGLPIRYEKSTQVGASENINNALDLAKYDFIKIMCQDDFFTQRNSIDLFVEALKKQGWVISNSNRARENGSVYNRQKAVYEHGNFDKNTVGMPSVIAFRKTALRFDPRLKTFCDLYFYYQLYQLYGAPALINDYTVAQRFWKGSLSANQPGQHKKDKELLIKEGKLQSRIIVAVVVFDRADNVRRWLTVWKQCQTKGADLVIIHNFNGDKTIAELCRAEGVQYIKRNNKGYDIGAFQDVCRERLKGFPTQYDYLLWCTDDTVPMTHDFITPFTEAINQGAGCACMHLSDEVVEHVRTTGFCITKTTAQRLRFPIDPVRTKLHCWQFEHRAGWKTMTQQIKNLGLSIVQVAPLPRSPLYDMGYWQRNDEAIKLRAQLDRQDEHDRTFNIKQTA